MAYTRLGIKQNRANKLTLTIRISLVKAREQLPICARVVSDLQTKRIKLQTSHLQAAIFSARKYIHTIVGYTAEDRIVTRDGRNSAFHVELRVGGDCRLCAFDTIRQKTLLLYMQSLCQG